MFRFRLNTQGRLQFELLVFTVSLLTIGCAESGSASSDDTSVSATAVHADKTSYVGKAQPNEVTEGAAVAETRKDFASSVAVAVAPAAEAPSLTTTEKPKRQPIYQEESNGAALIADAMKKAKRDHKNVLIEWGGNWCGWCYKLHDVFHKDEVVHPIVHEEFVLVLIDERANHDLMLEYGGKDREYSFPHLTVLDSDGAVLTNQETGSLEEGPKHDPKLVSGFLSKWVPAKLDAEAVLATAIQQAASEDKRVLMRVGTPYCGWCTVLAQFMQDHETLFGKDYVDIKIDTMRMTNGEAVAKRLEPSDAGGVPWMVILDEAGKTLASSVGPEGNIGYPYQPNEIAYFVKMLTDTRKRLTDSDMETIAADLNAYREAKEQKSVSNPSQG